MLIFTLSICFFIVFVSLSDKSDVFFDYIRVKIKVIGLDIEIKSKEKSTPSAKDKC